MGRWRWIELLAWKETAIKWGNSSAHKKKKKSQRAPSAS